MNNHELTHHGILGMKWGVQNGPPYPLSPGDHSASERRAGWRKSLSGNGGSSGRTTSNRVGTEQSRQFKLSDRQKKILMGAAIGTAVGLGVGMAYWYGGRSLAKNVMNSDLVIPAGELIKRVAPASEKGLHDRFYAAIGKDANKYKVLYNNQLRKQGVSDVVQKTISSKKELKIAGNDTCAKVFEDLQNQGKMNFFAGQNYDDFNQMVVMDDTPFIKQDFKKFYDELKNLGYDGFIDRNDQSYSSYFAKAPMILFNNSNLSIDSVSSLTPPKVLDFVKEYAKIVPRADAKNAYETGATWVATQASLGLTAGLIVGASKAIKDERKKENNGT